ncbi:MAG: nickel-dependent hydrogenase large subunit [Rubrivivax sp.]|nr:nickel-dependent hydrogenase large subunit [Rubrivivax sp.]
MVSPFDAALHFARHRDGRWALRSTRAEWAAPMLRGRPAEQAPQLLPGLYALCGGAHRLAARHALAAARGDASNQAGQAHQAHGAHEPHQALAADAQALHLDTLREHLRRLWLDAPRLVAEGSGAASPPPSTVDLARAPFMHLGADPGDPAIARAARRWVEAQVLEGDAAGWLAAWHADAAAHAANWAATSSTWPARWLLAMRGLLGERAAPCCALGAAALPSTLSALAEALRTQPGFALAPTENGEPAETGCWTRLVDDDANASSRPHRTGAVPALPLWLRHAARVAEIARLVTATGDGWLGQGAFAPPAHPLEGLGWCEMARGLLVHWVRLDGTGRIADYRVLAPTEWNFHPAGAAAQALADAADGGAALLQAVAAAYDPCVELRVQTAAQESVDA